MKKLFLSLAALMMTMSAPMMTSCSSEDLDEVAPEVVTPETDTHVETLTIAFPDQAETRVGVGNDNKLTGWEEGDEVTLVKTSFENLALKIDGTYTFRCTNTAEGIFTGSLPNGTSVNDCQYAFYNATGFATAADRTVNLYFSPKTRASQDMKDVVMLVAKNDGESHFAMQIFGSILKVTNNRRADITASVKIMWQGVSNYYDKNLVYENMYKFTCFETYTGIGEDHPFTLSKDAPTYVYLPVYNNDEGRFGYFVGLSAEDDIDQECSIVPFKENPGNAKLYKTTLEPPAKSGTAKATIDGREVDVKWVQLWEDGPKFAEYNVGVTDGKAESFGDLYCWGKSIDKDPTEAYREGSGVLSGTDDTATNLWGSNWRMPTKEELDGLLDNCDVEWTTVNGVNGRQFTGRDDYASFSVFLPAAGMCVRGKIDSQDYGEYWTSTPTPYGQEFAYFLLFNENDNWVDTSMRAFGNSVRAVLAE